MPDTPLQVAMIQEGRRQDWLANLLQVHPTQVSRWVNGVRTPDVGMQRAIAAALHRAPDTLWPASDREAA